MLPLTAIRPLMSSAGLDALSGALPQTQQMGPSAVENLKALAPAETVTGPGSVAPSSGSFSSLLGQMVQEVNGRQANAGAMVRELQSGGNVSLHQAVIAMEEATVSFQLMVEVRNKLLESYQELMRMQV
ncbi:MAG: flagellar hook-basal body complex protein FliE [Verrucomicrobia bacterium]|nr:flagellar hook-basal body complex protein FliE [Verrucomicrobiota bacterium]